MADFDIQAQLSPAALTVSVLAPTEEELEEEAAWEVFLDLPGYLDLALADGLTYDFSWEMGGTLTRLRSRLGLLPDTGGVTEPEWRAFVEQLVFTVDGQPRRPATPDFLPEE